MSPEETSRGDRLNTRTFAIKKGNQIFVVVPVIIYEGGDEHQRDGYAYMDSLFTPAAIAPFKAMEIAGGWVTMDPHNSKARDPHQANDITAPPPPMPHQAEPSAGGDDDPDNI